MNDNGMRVISYLIKSHKKWNPRNHESPIGIHHKNLLINRAILKMMKS